MPCPFRAPTELVMGVSAGGDAVESFGGFLGPPWFSGWKQSHRSVQGFHDNPRSYLANQLSSVALSVAPRRRVPVSQSKILDGFTQPFKDTGTYVAIQVSRIFQGFQVPRDSFSHLAADHLAFCLPVFA